MCVEAQLVTTAVVTAANQLGMADLQHLLTVTATAPELLLLTRVGTALAEILGKEQTISRTFVVNILFVCYCFLLVVCLPSTDSLSLFVLFGNFQSCKTFLGEDSKLHKNCAQNHVIPLLLIIFY